MPAPNRPPGVYDRPPLEAAEAATFTATLTETLTRFGYQSVETPVIEYADLFLTKSGDEAINRLFTFELYGRQLCLRSEFTAPAARLYVERFQHAPKPIRWQFAGPVFRYESPGKGHSRQFTMIGAELIGTSGVAGDAEVMGMAVQGLGWLGVSGWTLHIGHIGLVAQVLERFRLDRRTRRLILAQVENLRRGGRGRRYVEAQYEQMIALNSAPTALKALAKTGIQDYSAEMANALELVLESANLGSVGTGRTNEDVARRLLTKQQRAEQRGEVMAALDFLERLTAIQGPPDQAFPALDDLLKEDAEAVALLNSFKSSVTILGAYGVPTQQIMIQLGLARGVSYYTGFVFEVQDAAENQLCGGGRYDEFIRMIGASQDTPAVGFMYNLERVIEAAHGPGWQAPPEPAAHVLVVPIEDEDNAYAAQVASGLRTSLHVELYPPPNRSGSHANTYASRRGIPYAVFVGARERAGQVITIRDVRANTQTTRPLTELDQFAHDVLMGSSV